MPQRSFRTPQRFWKYIDSGQVLDTPCLYRKLKRGRSGGEVHLGWRVN